jgi:hypothetical protein
MTATAAPLDVALAYDRAWTSQHVDEALRLVDDEIDCNAPSGGLRGLAEYRPFLSNFAPSVTGRDMIAALGDTETAILVYDLHTALVGSALVCECLTMRDGRIIRNRLIFDQTPYAAARQRSS